LTTPSDRTFDRDEIVRPRKARARQRYCGGPNFASRFAVIDGTPASLGWRGHRSLESNA